MKNTKFILDRPKIDLEEIEKRQDLEKIVTGSGLNRPRIIKKRMIVLAAAVSLLASIWVMINFINDSSSGQIPKDNLTVKSVISGGDKEVKKGLKISAEKNTESANNVEQSLKRKEILNSNSESYLMNSDDKYIAKPNSFENKVSSSSSLKKFLGVPNIGGIHSGSIKSSELLKINIIESGNSQPITSFMVGYFNGTTDVMEFVSGNTLSEKLKHDLVEFNMGKMVFFTEMYNIDNEGKMRMLPPVNIKILPN